MRLHGKLPGRKNGRRRLPVRRRPSTASVGRPGPSASRPGRRYPRYLVLETHVPPDHVAEIVSAQLPNRCFCSRADGGVARRVLQKGGLAKELTRCQYVDPTARPVRAHQHLQLPLANDIESIPGIALAHQGFTRLNLPDFQFDSKQVQLPGCQVREHGHRFQTLSLVEGVAQPGLPGDGPGQLLPEHRCRKREELQRRDRADRCPPQAVPEQSPLAEVITHGKLLDRAVLAAFAQEDDRIAGSDHKELVASLALAHDS